MLWANTSDQIKLESQGRGGGGGGGDIPPIPPNPLQNCAPSWDLSVMISSVAPKQENTENNWNRFLWKVFSNIYYWALMQLFCHNEIQVHFISFLLLFPCFHSSKKVKHTSHPSPSCLSLCLVLSLIPSLSLCFSLPLSLPSLCLSAPIYFASAISFMKP